jgi:hypothetical protein
MVSEIPFAIGLEDATALPVQKASELIVACPF